MGREFIFRAIQGCIAALADVESFIEEFIVFPGKGPLRALAENDVFLFFRQFVVFVTHVAASDRRIRANMLPYILRALRGMDLPAESNNEDQVWLTKS